MDTIRNRLKKALLEIAESPQATAQERLEAVATFLKMKETETKRESQLPGKKLKRVSPPSSVLGTSM
jgi:hypothetical protein